MPHNYIKCFKTREKRWIFEPTDECKSNGKKFIKEISEEWTPPNYYYHFRSGGHLAALSVHTDSPFIAKLDIRAFFPSISKNKVLRALKVIGFTYKHALDIAEWSVVASKDDRRKKILPYGFVQSQFLAALCMDRSAHR